jgi:hypothetical protein
VVSEKRPAVDNKVPDGEKFCSGFSREDIEVKRDSLSGAPSKCIIFSFSSYTECLRRISLHPMRFLPILYMTLVSDAPVNFAVLLGHKG